MHVACPECGTAYALKPEVLERAHLRLRCRRCQHVWDPRHPFEAGPEAPPEPVPAGKVSAIEDEPGLDQDDLAAAVARALEEAPLGAEESLPPPAAARPRRRLLTGLYALAVVLVLVGVGGFGYAFRDRLPGLAEPLPELSEVQPAWRGEGDARQLVLSARLSNPGATTAEIARVKVKFLTDQGAWIGERLVTIPRVVIDGGGETQVEVALDGLPEGTASLELSVVADAPLS